MSAEMAPYAEYAWTTLPDDDSIETSSGRATYVPARYDRQLKEILAYHTGSPETYLTAGQEQELATLIQDGQAAQAEQEELAAQIAEAPELAPELQAVHDTLLDRVQAGKKAEQKLLECNLRLSSYLARASMNILPKGDQDAIGEDSKAGARRRSLLNGRLPWLPADFTSLKSKHAVLEDRIQVANMGLLRAVRRYVPGMINQKGKLVSFIAYAAPVIKTDLTHYIRRGVHYGLRTEGPDAIEKPIYIPADVTRRLNQARQDDWHDTLTPEERQELLDLDQMQDMLSLSDLYLSGGANEEKNDDIDEPPLLWAGEAIADPKVKSLIDLVSEIQLSDRIEQVLQTLSEREAGVIRLRFGLHGGSPLNLDAIGEVYKISRERVRQIESKAISKLRHASRSAALLDFMDFEAEGEPPIRAGDTLMARRSIGRTTLQLMVPNPTESEAESQQPAEPRERWQAYPNEDWEEPVRKTPAQMEAEHAATAAKFRDMLFDIPPHPKESLAKDAQSPYPKALVDTIIKTFGRELKPSHVADFWNDHLESFLEHLASQLGDDFSLDRATQLLSRLLGERMDDNDDITLTIPERLQGELGYVGAWLSHGTLHVLGSLGDYAGHEMGELGHLKIEGSVNGFAGNRMSGSARLEIGGDAGKFLGFGMRGQTSILAKGDVGDFCGCGMKKYTAIEVIGDTGKSPGLNAVGGEIIVRRRAIRPDSNIA